MKPIGTSHTKGRSESRLNGPLKHFRVLVVDDARDTGELLRSMLKESGASVVVARSEDAALRAYRRHPPHVLIAAIRRGYSEGHRLIQAIRDHNLEYRGFTPAIAITASREDKKRAIAAGFNAALTKPFSQTDIVNVVIQ